MANYRTTVTRTDSEFLKRSEHHRLQNSVPGRLKFSEIHEF